MHIHFTYTPQDYLEANHLFITKLAPFQERLLFRIWVPFGIVVLIAGVNWLFTQRGLVYGLVVTVLGVSSILWGTLKSWKFVSRRLLREFEQTPHLHGNIEAEIGESGIHLHMPVGTSDLGWGAFTATAETENLFLLLGHPRLFYMLPKRAFQPAELDSFRGLVERYIPKAPA